MRKRERGGRGRPFLEDRLKASRPTKERADQIFIFAARPREKPAMERTLHRGIPFALLLSPKGEKSVGIGTLL